MRDMPRPLAMILLAVTVAGVGWATVAAQAPSAPTFAYFYGLVLQEGANLSPEVQPVIAFVNGRSCGGIPIHTLVAGEGDDVPEDDVGRTVYVIDVLADGSNVYERAGCGHPGDPVMLYFPASGRTTTQQPLFQAGPSRVDLELDVVLGNRAGIPALAADGTN